MTEYTIRRGERTFQATKLDTLRELVRRGYLGPEDSVSVDGGPFQAVGSFAELQGANEADEADGEPPRSAPGPAPDPGTQPPAATEVDARAREEDDEEDVLASFLSGLDDGPSRSRPPPPEPEPPRDSSWLDRDAPPSLADLADSGPRDIPPVEDPGRPSRPALPPAPEPIQARPSPPQPPPPSPGRLQFQEPPDSKPMSFGDWVGDKGAGESGALLENFGVVDDGIVVGQAKRAGPNWWRVVLLVVVGAAVVGLWHTYVRTIAQTSYPSEAELVARQRGDGPAVPGEVAEPRERVAPNTALDKERRLKAQVVGEVPHFANEEQLEDALFQELINLDVRPRGVDIESIRLQQSGDYNRARPVEANVVVRLAGVKDSEGAVAELIMERQTLVWFVLGKYSTQGKLQFREVRTQFSPPNPYEKVTQGAELIGVWGGRRAAKDLFMSQD